MRTALLALALGLSASLLHAQWPPASGPPSVHRDFSELYAASRFQKLNPVGSSNYTLVPRRSLRQGLALKKEIFGYLPYWFVGRWNLLDYSLLTTVAYFSGEVAADGTVGNTHGWPKYSGDPSASVDVLAMINAAHTAGVRVVLCFTNFDGNQIQSLVSSPLARQTFLQQALTLVQAGNADGININFEGILSASRDDLTQLMTILADSFHTYLPGSQVSCAPTDFDTRQGDWDLAALNPVLDLFFFQGYGYHYAGSPSSGPVGLLPNSAFWGSTNITTLVDFVLGRIPKDKVLLGLPHFGYRWPTSGAEAKSPTGGSGVAFYYPDALGFTATYGRQWDAAGLSPWYRYQSGTQWYQGWYDDPESMSYKYQFALSRDLMGVGMWALGMDAGNHDIWDVLRAYFADSSSVPLPPRAPELALVRDSSGPGGNAIVVRWFPESDPVLGGYRLFCSTDLAGLNGLPVLDETALGRLDSTAVIQGVADGSTYFVRMVAVDSSRTAVSDSSDTYAVRIGGQSRYLIVDGFDRVTGSWSQANHAFAASYGLSVSAAGRSFDVAHHRAVASGLVSPDTYAGAIWFTGDQSVADRTFSPEEQLQVRSYLEGGGSLFVTGSEIGYDLGRATSPDFSPQFYNDYFKALYAGDKAASNAFSGATGSVFEGLSGQCGVVYPEDYPDYLSPDGGSIVCLFYAGGQAAGVQYSGTFGPGSKPGNIVYLGFTFETIGVEGTRHAMIQRVLDFFEGVSSVAQGGERPREVELAPNYPNPFNPTTLIAFTLPSSMEVTLDVHDILGRRVATLVQGVLPAGRKTVRFDARDLASGVYLLRLSAGGTLLARKMVLAR